MSLSLGANEEKKLIIINSIAKKYYNVKDIYFFMEENNIFINNSGYYEKFHINKHERFLKYSVTNISSPGYLNKENLTSPKIKGLSFFIQLPVKANSLNVFNEMVNDAKIFSKSYKCNLYNSDKELLSNKILKNLKNIAKSYKDEY
jgi:FtsZ-interacting cell division protein ZipA